MRWIVAVLFVLAACEGPAPTSAPLTPAPSSAIAAAPAPTTTAAATPAAGPTTTVAAPSARPQPSLDARSVSLIEALNAWCMTSVLGTAAMPLDVIGQLASGRSARETADVLAQSRCLLQPRAYGDSASEVVTVGAYRSDGAVLWVDHGFWRIARVPIDYGYLELLWDSQRGGQRELFFEIWSGGSAGARGFVAVSITGITATMALHAAPGASHMNAKRIDGDHVLLTGRQLPERRWGIDSNCCLPGGHEWLWRWTPTGYTLVGERQDRDPYYALNALLGAIDSGYPQTAADVATPRAIDAAAAFFGPGLFWTYKGSSNANEQQQAELLRWSVLPGAAPIAAAVVRYEVARYEPAGPSAVITLERIGDGWMATDVRAGTLP